MAPPKFKDISKAVSDLFKDDFGAGTNKVEYKTNTASGASFKATGKRSVKDGSVSASIESSSTGWQGLKFKETFNNKNELVSEVTAENKVTDGTKFVFENTFTPNDGISNLKLKANYKADAFHFGGAFASSKVDVDGTFAYENYVAGGAVSYDAAKGAVSSTQFGLGVSQSDVKMTATIKNGSAVEGCVYHNTSDAVKTAVKMNWAQGKSAKFAVATKYALDKDAFVKAKIDTALIADLSYTQKIRQGVTLALYTNINVAAMNQDAHAVGWSLKFSA